MGWGGVGCDSIRHYWKIWCDATLRIRLYWLRAHTGGVDGYWKVMQKVNSRQHSFPSPRQTQWFVVQIHSKSPMEMGTHWLRLAYRLWRSCKISHAVKRKGHFDPSPGFEAQNPVRVASHCKTDVFFHGCFPHEIELAPQRNKNFQAIMGRCQVRRVLYGTLPMKQPFGGLLIQGDITYVPNIPPLYLGCLGHNPARWWPPSFLNGL